MSVWYIVGIFLAAAFCYPILALAFSIEGMFIAGIIAMLAFGALIFKLIENWISK